jgi:hypothetical protein
MRKLINGFMTIVWFGLLAITSWLVYSFAALLEPSVFPRVGIFPWTLLLALGLMGWIFLVAFTVQFVSGLLFPGGKSRTTAPRSVDTDARDDYPRDTPENGDH